jgi:hypothetical protein
MKIAEETMETYRIERAIPNDMETSLTPGRRDLTGASRQRAARTLSAVGNHSQFGKEPQR